MEEADFEKLGAFYLGRSYDLASRTRGEAPVLYDSRDLVTHAVCVGMTGSGKTGLCIALLEEAAIDAIPAIVIDPKGDLANLLLTFPDLQPADFLPWINVDDARRKGLEPEEYARQQAAMWKDGLAAWGQGPQRIRRLREAADFAVYTPGSTAGIPVSLLRSFAAPPPAIRDDGELLAERIAATSTSLLRLANVDADPIASPEHLLLATLLNHAWRSGRDLDLAGLIHDIQSPPVTRIGVMELESFYPAAKRFELAMKINTLAASPGFAKWMEGKPLDIASLLHTPDGTPRVAILSIAHLNDAERMFFVSLLLNDLLAWVRTQSGTTSLRAILYMDEIAGYCPPSANPPSKGPLLTLMKQARAFGLGVLLATQNPVDLDYKGLSNAGTWFIGRLQTERDKLRVLDGLEGAAAGAGASFDRATLDRTLSMLGNRVFLMNNVHEDAPEVFEVRWVMSYLRGPLTRDQIRRLMDTRREPDSAPEPTANTVQPVAAQPLPASSATGTSTTRPVLPPGITQRFLAAGQATTNGPIYRPMLLGTARVHFADARADVDYEKTVSYLIPLGDDPVVDWDAATPTPLAVSELDTESAPGASFGSLPPMASRSDSYDRWRKRFAEMIHRRERLELRCCPELKLTSRPDEHERDFRARLAHAAHETRDAAMEKLRQRYAPKLAALEDRIRRARQALEVQQEQARQSKMSTAVSFGTAILSAVFGRKLRSVGHVGRAGTAMRGIGRSMKEAGDVQRARENLETLQAQLDELDRTFRQELHEVQARYDPAALPLEQRHISPKKSNITVESLVLAWMPVAAS